MLLDLYSKMQAEQSDYVRKNIKAFKLTTSPRFFLVPPPSYSDLTLRKITEHSANNLEKNPSNRVVKYPMILPSGRDKNFVFN
jgi:hypothetical protein